MHDSALFAIIGVTIIADVPPLFDNLSDKSTKIPSPKSRESLVADDETGILQLI